MPVPICHAGDRLERELGREVLEAGGGAEQEVEVVEPMGRRLAGDPTDEMDGGSVEPVRGSAERSTRTFPPGQRGYLGAGEAACSEERCEPSIR